MTFTLKNGTTVSFPAGVSYKQEYGFFHVLDDDEDYLGGVADFEVAYFHFD